MRVVKAKLIKRCTDDGLFEIEEDVPVGKEYLVDLDTMQMAQGHNYVKKVNWYKLIIFDVFGGWLPRELLQMSEEN